MYDGSASGALYLDTTRLITDTSGNVVWEWQNTDPFGNNMPNENPSGQGTFTCNLGFPGQYRDRETNTFYNTYRDAYDAATGRYTQFDPIGLRGGINGFVYVEGNPLSFADPSGLCPAGTHRATDEEMKTILDKAKEIEDKNYTHDQMQCNQFVAKSVNGAKPGTFSKEFNTTEIGKGDAPMDSVDAKDANVALFKDPGHVVLVSGKTDGKMSRFEGSQTSSGPATVNVNERSWWKPKVTDSNVKYFALCIPN